MNKSQEQQSIAQKTTVYGANGVEKLASLLREIQTNQLEKIQGTLQHLICNDSSKDLDCFHQVKLAVSELHGAKKRLSEFLQTTAGMRVIDACVEFGNNEVVQLVGLFEYWNRLMATLYECLNEMIMDLNLDDLFSECLTMMCKLLQTLWSVVEQLTPSSDSGISPKFSEVFGAFRDALRAITLHDNSLQDQYDFTGSNGRISDPSPVYQSTREERLNPECRGSVLELNFEPESDVALLQALVDMTCQKNSK